MPNFWGYGLTCLILIGSFIYIINKTDECTSILVLKVPLIVAVIMLNPTFEFSKAASSLNSDLKSVVELGQLNECMDEFTKIDYENVKEIATETIWPVVFIQWILKASYVITFLYLLFFAIAMMISKNKDDFFRSF